MVHGNETAILLVDDRHANLLALEAVLERLGTDMVRASSGREALARFEERTFAVILLDVQMPGTSGFEVAAEIRKREHGQRRTPIIFLTAYGLDETILLKAYGEGAADFVEQPFVPEVLRSKVSVFIDLFRVAQQREVAEGELRSQVEKLQAALEELRVTTEELQVSRKELLQAQYVVEQERRRYRELFLTVPDAYLVTDCSGIIQEVNSAGLHLLGMKHEHLIGKPLALYVVNEERPAFVKRQNTICSSRGSHKWDTRLAPLGGTVVDVSISVALVGEGDHNQKQALHWTLRDIEERKKAETEERLRNERALESQSRLTQAIAENAASCLFMIDTDGFTTYMNPAAEKVTGYTLDEIRGQNLHHAIHHSRPDGSPFPANECLLHRALRESGVLRNHEDVFVRKDGSFFPVLSHISAIDRGGNRRESVLEFQDITERKKVEAELAEARDRALEANQAKSAFLASMSHELRTPLNAIIGYTEMLQEELCEIGQERMAEDLAKVKLSGTHLLTVISDILDLSKIEAGKMELTLDEFDVEQAVRETVAMVYPLIEKNGNGLVIRCADGLGTMRNDHTRFRQVLFNLLSNAAKFTEHGTVTVECRRDRLAENSDWVEVRITDTGIGMTPEQVKRLFEKFYQSDSSYTRRHGGTGLGLAISQSLSRIMGGEVGVESEPERGSVFTVMLPADIEAPAAFR